MLNHLKKKKLNLKKEAILVLQMIRRQRNLIVGLTLKPQLLVIKMAINPWQRKENKQIPAIQTKIK